jgi:hypothetical protein
VFKHAQLLQRLSAFQRRRFPLGVLQQQRLAEHIQPDVTQHGHIGRLARIRNARARKVERVAAQVYHHLHHAGRLVIFGLRVGIEAAHHDAGVVQQGLHGAVNRFGVQQRFVALNVDINLAVGVAGDFRHAVGA